MTKLYLICGKGGVGKTTSASAAALALASKGEKTLLLSTDFTPAIGDVMETDIGSEFTKINDYLTAMEIDSKTITERWISKFGPDFHQILSRLVDIENLDRESENSLLEYISSAPSLREETMLDFIVDLSENENYDKIIWDSAPAGETLNLLNMPSLLKKHLKSGTKIYDSLDKLTKFRSGRKSISKIIDEWTELSDYISRYIKENAAFIIVTNPERVVYNRTKDIYHTLLDYKMNVYGCIINKIFRNISDKTFKEQQDKALNDLYSLFHKLPVAELEHGIHNVKTRQNLEKTGQKLIKELQIM
ncbi:ArsA family ATPase [Flexistipes sinusarabici]|uniref:ArsA family ATPase n=1 Tax=Flexistipes sinusarabici TaxID=2352 RepID=UPI0023561A8B|nr:TRC40/GET3/ArsA family transport-energizing ATPase [Flexistipes sinusarabici]